MALLALIHRITAATPVLGGADVVAYQTLKPGARSLAGDPRFSVNLSSIVRGAPNQTSTFLFATADNAEAFAADPWKYVPAYGGFCAYGLAFENSSAASGGWPWERSWIGPPGDPDVWKLHNGRLFIAFLPGAMEGFFANVESAVAVADARWATWWADGSSAGYGVFNSLCLGPPARWALHSCGRTPQPVSGVPSIPPVSDECLAAVDKACSAVSPAKTGVVLGHACSNCLDDNSAVLISEGLCPNDGVGDLAGVVDKVYCK